MALSSVQSFLSLGMDSGAFCPHVVVQLSRLLTGQRSLPKDVNPWFSGHLQ